MVYDERPGARPFVLRQIHPMNVDRWLSIAAYLPALCVWLPMKNGGNVLLSMRAYMAYDTRPNDDWSTTLEYDLPVGSIAEAMVEEVAMGMAAGLAKLLLNNVVIDRVVVSTWAPDSQPYDPENVRSIPIGLNGENAFAFTDPADDDLVVLIRKAVDTGRTGKMQLRGCFTVSALRTENGSWRFTLVSQAEIETDTADAWSAFRAVSRPVLIGVVLLDTIYSAAAAGVKQLVSKVYSDIPSVRSVTDLVVVRPDERQDTQ